MDIVALFIATSFILIILTYNIIGIILVVKTAKSSKIKNKIYKVLIIWSILVVFTGSQALLYYNLNLSAQRGSENIQKALDSMN